MICPNCNRDETVILMTKHHMIPKSKDGENDESNYLWLCKDCHAQIHLLYTNNYLRDNLNTPKLILSDEKIVKFGKFASKQTKRISKKKSKNK